jgi:hypothetical protein
MTKADDFSPIATKIQLFEFLKTTLHLNHHGNYTSELFEAYKMLGPIEKQRFDLIVSIVGVDDLVTRTICTEDN